MIASLLGIPKERAGEFTEWVRGFLEYGLTDVNMRSGSAIQIFTFLSEQIQDRKANPGEAVIR